MWSSGTCVIALMLIVLGAAPASESAQQQTIQRVKDLYAQAAYEDALGVLAVLPPPEDATEVGRYRAACLLALGRTQDAQKAVAEIVETHPEYLPDVTDTSPRVLDLFHVARRTILPDVVRRMYREARALMDRQESAAAIEQFVTLIRLLDDPDVAGDPTLADLKVLSTGFLELTRTRVAALALNAATPVPSSAPLRQAVIPATPISQQLPAWAPPDRAAERREFQGAVVVRIGADGKVVSAVIQKPTHPAYDALLLAAARKWVYEPARQNGAPVASERLVQVVLKPPVR